MNISKEVKVGLLAVVALVLLYFGVNYLKGSDFFSSSRTYRVIYDNVDGLTASNAVLVNGLTVGKVRRIDLLPEQGNKLQVTVDVDKRIAVGQGSRAVLADGGLLGGKVIQLQIRQNTPPLEKDGLLIGLKETGLSALIREKTLPVLNNVDSLTAKLNVVVGHFDQTGLILNETLRGANRVTGTLDLTIAENRAAIRAMLTNVNRLSASLDQTTRQLQPILTKVDTFADSVRALQLKQTLDNANRSIANLQGILTNVEQGRGSLGKLTTDDSLYTNVNKTTASLERLLTDLRENPKRYVHFSLFGRKEKKPDPATTKPGSVTVTTSTVTTTQVDTTRQPE